MRYKARDEGKDKQAIKKDIWTSIYKKHPKPLPQQHVQLLIKSYYNHMQMPGWQDIPSNYVFIKDSAFSRIIVNDT